MYCERWSSEADAEDLAIPDFRTSDNEVVECRDAGKDQKDLHVQLNCLAITNGMCFHLSALHEKRNLLRTFIDTMCNRLAMIYVTNNGPRVQIKADRTLVENIVSCFAQADMLYLTLAERTMGSYVEQNQQLTILTPTGFQE